MTYVKFNQPALKSLDNFLDQILNNGPSVQSNGSYFPPVNIFETKDNYELEFIVPGRKKEDLKISVDKNILTVSFEKNEETTSEDRKPVTREYSLQPFKRSFTLDDKVVSDNIAARYENGLLILTVPKKEEVKAEPKQIAVN
jgi:HSP20 family protein